MRFSRPYTLFRRGQVWYYLLRGEKTRHTTGETSKKKAAEYVDRIAGNPRGARLTLSEFADGFFREGSDFLTRQRGKGRSMASHSASDRQAHLERWILPSFGQTALSDIMPVAIERWLAKIERSNQTRNHILISLRMILRDARRSGLLIHNPADDVEPFGRTSRRRDALSLEELALLFPPAREDLVRIWGSARQAVAYFLMATTGMRIGEVCALRWEHVRFDIPAVLIVQAIKRDGSIGAPKNGKPRSALLPARAVELLTWWKGTTPYPEFVVHGLHGGHSNPAALAHAWAVAAGRAGISVAGRFLGAHALRHTYQTRLRGLVPDDALRYMLGHQSVAMTERYDQGTPEERVLRIVGQRAALDDLWNEKSREDAE